MTTPTSSKYKNAFSVIYQFADLNDEEDDKSSEFYRSDISLNENKLVGTGSFGTVMHCVLKETNEHVAVKKVMQDQKYKVFFFSFL
jgi:hypothetical protein